MGFDVFWTKILCWSTCVTRTPSSTIGQHFSSPPRKASWLLDGGAERLAAVVLQWRALCDRFPNAGSHCVGERGL